MKVNNAIKHNILLLTLCLITAPAWAAKTTHTKKSKTKVEKTKKVEIPESPQPPVEEKKESYFKSLLPNNINYEATNDQVSIHLDDRPTLHIRTKQLTSSLGDASRFASKISFSKTPDYNHKGFKLLWSPIFSLAFYNFEVDTDSVFFKDTTFQLFRVVGGMGPELRYIFTNNHTFSFLIAPAANYSWVSWSSPVSGGSFAKANFTGAATLSYIMPFKERWNFTLFSKALLEDTKVWKEALTSSQGLEVPVKSVINYTTGIAIGYRWD